MCELELPKTDLEKKNLNRKSKFGERCNSNFEVNIWHSFT